MPDLPSKTTHRPNAMAENVKKAIKELANSLQTVMLLTTKIRRQLAGSAQDVIELESAADKAVRTIRRLRPDTPRH